MPLHVRFVRRGYTRLDGAEYISYSFGDDVHARALADIRPALIDVHALLARSTRSRAFFSAAFGGVKGNGGGGGEVGVIRERGNRISGV